MPSLSRCFVRSSLVCLALGFTLTVATIWLVPIIRVAVGWGPAFSVLAVGPVLGIASMAKLQRSPQASRIAGGRG